MKKQRFRTFEDIWVQVDFIHFWIFRHTQIHYEKKAGENLRATEACRNKFWTI